MRRAAKRRAESVRLSQAASAASISDWAMRIFFGVRESLSKRSVYSMTARSPRFRTSARIAATTAFTSAADSRFMAMSFANPLSKPGFCASSLSGTGKLLCGGAETLDPSLDFLGPGLEGGTVDGEPRGDVGDALDLDEAIRLERGPG